MLREWKSKEESSFQVKHLTKLNQPQYKFRCSFCFFFSLSNISFIYLFFFLSLFLVESKDKHTHDNFYVDGHRLISIKIFLLLNVCYLTNTYQRVSWVIYWFSACYRAHHHHNHHQRHHLRDHPSKVVLSKHLLFHLN